jgi:hypothetical protein
MTDSKTYSVNGKTYYQRKLVLGQIEPLIAFLEDVTFAELSAAGIVKALGGKLPKVLAIVVTPEGESPRDKDVAALAETLAAEMDIETALEVAADFLSFNPVSSIFGRINGIMNLLMESTKSMNREPSSPAS